MINWKTISQVLIDMDGTLLDLYFDDYFWRDLIPRHYAEKNNLPSIIAKEKVMALYKKCEGTLNWYSLDHWTKVLNLDISVLYLSITHLIVERPHAGVFLDAVRHSGRRVALVTNAHNKGVNLKMRHSNLADHLDTIISAHDVGLPKENIDFWERLQKVEPFNPDSTLLIDDSLPVLRSARQYGIAQLLSIQRPNSRKPPQQLTEFTAISDFIDIMPYGL